MQHPMRITRTQLADGRELLYFDDTPAFVSAERTRPLVDVARRHQRFGAAPGPVDRRLVHLRRAPDEPHVFAAGE